jgi:hypothetical protein
VACRDEPCAPVLLAGLLRTTLARLVCIRTRQHSTGTRRSPVPGRVACVRGAKSEAQKLHRVSLKVRWRLFHPLPGAVERTNGVQVGATHQLTAVEEAETALVEEGGLLQAAGALASATGEDTPPSVSTAPPAVVARPALAAEVALAVGTLGGSGAFLVGHKPGRA